MRGTEETCYAQECLLPLFLHKCNKHRPSHESPDMERVKQCQISLKMHFYSWDLSLRFFFVYPTHGKLTNIVQAAATAAAAYFHLELLHGHVGVDAGLRARKGPEHANTPWRSATVDDLVWRSASIRFRFCALPLGTFLEGRRRRLCAAGTSQARF